MSVIAPLAVGLGVQAWGHDGRGLAAGVIAAIGALVGAISPQRGPVREKVARTGAGVLLGAGGLAVGRFAAGGGWGVVVLLAGLGAIAALVSAVNANVSFGGLQFLVYVAVGSGLVGVLPPAETAELFVAGGLWSLLLTLLAALSDPVDPDRAVVHAVFGAVQRLLVASGTGEHPTRRAGVTEALNRAYDQIVRSRGRTPGRSPRLVRLAGVLNSMQPLVEGAVALYRSGERASTDDLRAVSALGGAVLSGGPPAGDPPVAVVTGSPGARQVREGIRSVWEVVAGETATGRPASAPPTWRTWGSDLVSRTVGNPESRAFAARLALCMGVAEVVREHLPYEHPYWVLLTVAIVLKPDFGSVFSRAVQRTTGTLVGVLLGAAALAVVPHDAWILVPMAFAAAAMPWAQAANYGLFVVSLTPLVVLLLDLAAPADAGVVTARLVDTAVGAVIVLVFGYLVWPRTWRSTFDVPLQRVVRALDDFVGVAFTAPGDVRRRARRRTFRALTELQTALQRQLAEPPPMSTRAASWWPLVVQMERTADAVIGAAVAVDTGTDPPAAGEVDSLRRSIRALDDHPPSAPRPAPGAHASGVLAPVAREVDAALRLRSSLTSPRRVAGA